MDISSQSQNAFADAVGQYVFERGYASQPLESLRITQLARQHLRNLNGSQVNDSQVQDITDRVIRRFSPYTGYNRPDAMADAAWEALRGFPPQQQQPFQPLQLPPLIPNLPPRPLLTPQSLSSLLASISSFSPLPPPTQQQSSSSVLASIPSLSPLLTPFPILPFFSSSSAPFSPSSISISQASSSMLTSPSSISSSISAPISSNLPTPNLSASAPSQSIPLYPARIPVIRVIHRFANMVRLRIPQNGPVNVRATLSAAILRAQQGNRVISEEEYWRLEAEGKVPLIQFDNGTFRIFLPKAMLPTPHDSNLDLQDTYNIHIQRQGQITQTIPCHLFGHVGAYPADEVEHYMYQLGTNLSIPELESLTTESAQSEQLVQRLPNTSIPDFPQGENGLTEIGRQIVSILRSHRLLRDSGPFTNVVCFTLVDSTHIRLRLGQGVDPFNYLMYLVGATAVLPNNSTTSVRISVVLRPTVQENNNSITLEINQALLTGIGRMPLAVDHPPDYCL